MYTDHYVYHSAIPGIYAEVYLPKKAMYQGAIYNALQEGFSAENVLSYLLYHEEQLREEFREYRDFEGQKPLLGNTTQEAQERINRYQSTFEGYSVYDVDGSFRGMEENIHVVRIMFKCPDSIIFREAATDYPHLMRVLVGWYLNQYSVGRTTDKKFHEFTATYPSLQGPPFNLTEGAFERVLRVVQDWIDDCALFVFCYFLKIFCQRVLETQSQEEEVWVTSFFNLSINVMKRTGFPK